MCSMGTKFTKKQWVLQLKDRLIWETLAKTKIFFVKYTATLKLLYFIDCILQSRVHKETLLSLIWINIHLVIYTYKILILMVELFSTCVFALCWDKDVQDATRWHMTKLISDALALQYNLMGREKKKSMKSM